MKTPLNLPQEYDYNYARPIGQKKWEKVVDSESPSNEDGSYAGPPDRFKLEDSGWQGHRSVEFKPLSESFEPSFMEEVYEGFIVYHVMEDNHPTPYWWKKHGQIAMYFSTLEEVRKDIDQFSNPMESDEYGSLIHDEEDDDEEEKSHLDSWYFP